MFQRGSSQKDSIAQSTSPISEPRRLTVTVRQGHVAINFGVCSTSIPYEEDTYDLALRKTLTALDDAESFLKKMKESASSPSEQAEFELNFRAFLTANQSVPDHLLHEYSVRFGFNIPLDDSHFRRTFFNKAKADSRREVAEFSTFWKQETFSQRDPQNPANILFSKRHIQIHRVPVKPDLAKLAMIDSCVATESVTIQKYDGEMKLTAIEHYPAAPREQPLPPSVHVEWYLNGEPVLQLCEERLKVMRRFVEAAHSTFPP